ncbi:hypothetical protein [Anabaena sp. CCY 9910]|uniref:hypothetical protein n=1 Tax=Anabaena sp. CCY 9910 TaxID=3103870 RepID=UPI0039E03420
MIGQSLYILQGRNVIPVSDKTFWVTWMLQNPVSPNRVLSFTKIADEMKVVTTFVGFNLQTEQGQPPLLFETKIEGGWFDQYLKRSSTYEQAEAEHDRIVTRLRGYFRLVLPGS